MNRTGGPNRPEPGAARREDTLPGWAAIRAVTVLLVLAVFLWQLRGILNPFLGFFALWAVMTPFRGARGHGTVLMTAAVLTLFWLLATTGTLLLPFVLSLVLAYVLDPVVDWLESKGSPRVPGIILLTLPAVALLALVVFVAVPAAVGELADLVNRAPLLFERAADWLEASQTWLMGVDLPFFDEQALQERLRSVDSDAVVAFLDERRAALGDRVWGGVLGVGRGLGAALGILGFVVLTPVLTFYLLRDWDSMTAALRDLVPLPHRDAVVSFAGEYDHLLGRYLRGQATVAAAIGALTALGLWISGFPYAGTLGLVVAVFSVVPYLGLLLSLVPALFIALISGSVGLSLVKIAVVYGLAQGLEGAVISPRVLGDSVGLHPVLVVLALAVGGFFFGFVGLLIGVPVAVGVKLLIERGVARYRKSETYRGQASESS